MVIVGACLLVVSSVFEGACGGTVLNHVMGLSLHPGVLSFLACSFKVWASFLLLLSLKLETLAWRPLLLDFSLINCYSGGGRREHPAVTRKLVEGPFLAHFSIPHPPTPSDRSNVASMQEKFSIELYRLDLLIPYTHHLLPFLSKSSLPVVPQHSKGLCMPQWLMAWAWETDTEVEIPTPPLTPYETVGKLPNYSELHLLPP